jgi:hypothetical protein
MKYIEELKPGDIFVWKQQRYVLSSDFRPFKNNTTRHMSISIQNGSCKWFKSDEIVDIAELYYRDKEGNILLVKEYENNDTQNNDFS